MKFKTSFSLPLSILLNPVEEVWAGQLCQGCAGQPPQSSFLEAVPVQSSSCQSSHLILFLFFSAQTNPNYPELCIFVASDYIFSFIKSQTHEHLHIKRCLGLYTGSALTCSSTALPAAFSQLLCAESLSCLTTNSRKLWLPTYHSNKQNSLEKNKTLKFGYAVLSPSQFVSLPRGPKIHLLVLLQKGNRCRHLPCNWLHKFRTILSAI